VKIVVCCKSVPGAVTDVVVAPDGKALQYQSQFNAMNECDEYAIEEALALKSTYGGEITVLTMGSITTQEILYQGLAKGADHAVRIDAQVQDARAASLVLAAALKKLEFDLVLTGTQARDTLSSFVGVAIAERLDLPSAFSAIEVEMDGDNALKVRKELGGGRYADVRLPLPALLCVQTGIQELTYVPPARVMRARQKPLKSYSLADLGLTEEAIVPQGYSFHSVFPPERVSKVEFIEGAAPAVAEALMAKIREVL
jgi:electron transfer flavoprotein beta subunit